MININQNDKDEIGKDQNKNQENAENFVIIEYDK